MKRILFAITLLTLLLPGLRQAEAGVEVSIDFFYDNIGSDGSWVELEDYGYCWQPSVAISNSHWRPYADGYWAYTDVGWTWVSNEDFGWATYHYGRWTRLRDRGWFWVPGRSWGPAWVSWRTGGDYVGWAPLPPHGIGEVVYESHPIGHQVDVEFDIGPDYYNFVDVRYLGEPVLIERIVEPRLNVTYISQTVNVTNITYTNSVVYNHGPDYNTVSRYSTRPIRRMTLERDANVDLSAAIKSKGVTRVEGDKLIVAAPATLQQPPKPVAPKTVKEKIAKPVVDHGWSSVADPKAQAELKEKLKKEDPKNVPPPSLKPREGAETALSPAIASPGPAAVGKAPATMASPALPPDNKGKGKDKGFEAPLPTAAASVPPATIKKERDEKPAPAVTPSSSNMTVTTPVPPPNKPKDRQQNPPSTLTTLPDGTPFREPAKREKDVTKEKRAEHAPDTMPPARQPGNAPPTEIAPRKPKGEITPALPNREALSDSQPKRPMPPEQVPPNREAPPDSQPKRPMPPERVAPPKSEAPPEAPRKHPLPPERVAPPSGPAANAPGKPQAPPNKPPSDKKAPPPTPAPR